MSWQFVAHDLRTNSYLGDVPARGVTWVEGENASSSLEFSLDLAEETTVSLDWLAQLRLTEDDDMRTTGGGWFRATEEPSPTATIRLGGVYRQMLEPGRVKVTPLRDGNPLLGSHIVWGRSFNGRMLSVQCAGMWSIFSQRRLAATRTYTSVDQHDIARDLIAYAQQAQGNIGLLLDPNDSGVTRDRTYDSFEEQPVAKLVEELAAVDDGFEFSITTALVADDPVSTWRPHYPRRGRTVTQSHLSFTLGENLGAYSLAQSSPVTTMRGIGAGEGDTMLRATAQRSDLLTAGWPLLEDSRSRKDVSVQATLNSHAHADLRTANDAAETWTLDLVWPDDVSVPLGAWGIGDDARIIIPPDVDWLYPEGREVVKRIVGQRVEISDDGGVDRVSLTMGALRV